MDVACVLDITADTPVLWSRLKERILRLGFLFAFLGRFRRLVIEKENIQPT
jgi:hypothetical protein